MSLLIDETPDAAVWVERTLGGVPMAESLGRLAAAVIWTDSYLQDGEPIGGNDPSPIVDEINEQGLPLLHGHDPGRPAGRFIAAHAFTSPGGTQFVAAILAYYEPDSLLSFASFGINPFPVATLPTRLGFPLIQSRRRLSLRAFRKKSITTLSTPPACLRRSTAHIHPSPKRAWPPANCNSIYGA